ncbi:MAG: hypothetical protein KA739_15305 [Pseudomonadales bacterium]|jgi:hypothetical protein|nr:hypothetical protein [Pseudomonadales bacterium]MBP6228159.1 hypothetical protein [Pseudomonadales bacterium]
MRSTLNERVAGFVLVTFFLLPLAILGYLILTWVVFFGRTARGRAGARALDHFVNAAVFNGYAWESVSSHAWREQHRWWARLVIAFTDRIDAQHCRRANKREQPVVDLVLHKRLHEQTIL